MFYIKVLKYHADGEEALEASLRIPIFTAGQDIPTATPVLMSDHAV